jgi:hypothetical protein
MPRLLIGNLGTSLRFTLGFCFVFRITVMALDSVTRP